MKLEINRKLLLIVFLLIFIFVSLDMISTYRVISRNGIEYEKNDRIRELFVNFKNYTFLVFGFFVFVYCIILCSGVYLILKFFGELEIDKEKYNKIADWVFVIVTLGAILYVYVPVLIKNFKLGW